MRKQKLVVTHLAPHLDEVAGIWLIKRFWSGWEKARLKFILAGGETPDGKPAGSNPNVVCLGVGGGEFDEHGRDERKCSAFLVWEKTKKLGFAPPEKNQKKAIEKLIEWVRQVDTAEPGAICLGDFSLPAVLAGQRKISQNDCQAVGLGEKILDALFASLEEKVVLERDWEKGRVFNTSWGRGIGVVTRARSGARSLAWTRGFAILILIDANRGFRQIWASPGLEIDLTPVYDLLRKREPEVFWFLHHSKAILLSGDDVAPKVICSRLDLEEIIDVFKKGIDK